MKPSNTFFNLILAGLLAVTAIGFWKFQPAAQVALAQSPIAGQSACDSSRPVQVSGSAVVNVVPDWAQIMLGVETNGFTPDGTQNANFTEMQKVIAALKALGVEARDISTANNVVYPVYSDYSSLAIQGFRIDNTIAVTLRDVNLVDDAILAALKVGANEVQDVQFYTSELRKYRDQARDLAVKAAGEKAQALASAAGTQAGCVLSITENTSTQYYGWWSSGRQVNNWAQNVVQNAAPANAAGQGEDAPISLGQIAVRAEISASYSLK